MNLTEQEIKEIREIIRKNTCGDWSGHTLVSDEAVIKITKKIKKLICKSKF